MKQLTTISSSVLWLDTNRFPVSPIGHVLKEVCLSQGSRLPKGPYIWHCSKAEPSFVPHNSLFTSPTEVILSILIPSCGKLPLAHHFNSMAPILHRQEDFTTSRVPSPTLSPIGSLHQGWHESQVSLWCLFCVLGVASTPKRKVCNTCLHQLELMKPSTILVIGTPI
jgi:hypothetical protein